MKPVRPAFVVGSLLCCICATAAPAADLKGFPFTDEDLSYSVNWPSGLSLGETHMRARHEASQWKFELAIDAGIPGYQVKDRYNSALNAAFCSTHFSRDISHGSRKAREEDNIEAGEATRSTMSGGGESHIVVPDCIKDALGLLYFTRRELGQGRVPPEQNFLLGGMYKIRFDYAGEQDVKVGEQTMASDKLLCTVTTQASDIKFEAYFARDAARTPLVVRVPFQMGTFSLELVR